MAHKKSFSLQYANFYEDFDYRNPFVVLFFIVISGGFYAVHFLYCLNLKFELWSSSAPNATRGLYVMLFLPCLVGYLMFLNAYLLRKSLLPFSTLEIISWSILLYLILRYLYDFCVAFGFFTQTPWQIWYLTFLPAPVALTLFLIGETWGLLFLFFTLTSFATMQEQLNRRHFEYHFQIQRSRFNTLTPREGPSK